MTSQTARLAAAALAALLAGAAAQAEIAPSDVAIADGALETPVADAPGDAERGKAWYADRGLGNCMTCHQNAALPEISFQGDVAPPLDGVGARYSEAELRAIVVNSKEVFGEQTFMPAFYRIDGLKIVRKESVGKPILDAQQVEDVVAYLKTLTD
ncbi:sulfur oxidation c-type cytochrome SoxX [Rubrimonas cliftonensis]|uniref:Monoheme cytochrome SoxX (Sulfur oxidation) n=1 Tax=Rubrimonas cliftonensis TaxID=89524 RepID=A0A1H4DGP9_9RHOB|nr:sulfur oxidation c-type cytochrome SoxX [Rubrimonas cliftonensis]SEA71686.1 monoheme cytochrome SoxX (sulfur oxidation) [Rubrimonas cliftonensis]